MITEAQWSAHLKESADRNRGLELAISHLSEQISRLHISESSIADLVSQISGLQITVESFASREARIRASAQLAVAARDGMPSLDGSDDTHTGLHVLSAVNADAALESLSFWKARPALVVGFIGALIALGVSFGLPITKEQTGAILAVVTVALALLASMRGRRTTAALVRAGERRGALAGPDSQPRNP